jgi:hypothetical protein
MKQMASYVLAVGLIAMSMWLFITFSTALVSFLEPLVGGLASGLTIILLLAGPLCLGLLVRRSMQ